MAISRTPVPGSRNPARRSPFILQPRGFTLVELLVVITIIGILIGLTMPAVQFARERARLNTCANNLGQLGKGVQAHIAAFGYYPSGGWNRYWLGQPDFQQTAPTTVAAGTWVPIYGAGTDINQPGSWIYNLLPYIDMQSIHDQGAGLPEQVTYTWVGGQTFPGNNQNYNILDKRIARQWLMQSLVPSLNCPSRRRGLQPWNSARRSADYGHSYYNLPYANNSTGGSATLVPYTGRVAKSDYAICSGGPANTAVAIGGTSPTPVPNEFNDNTGPQTWLLGYRGPSIPNPPPPDPNWPHYPYSSGLSSAGKPTQASPPNNPNFCSGVSFERSMVRPDQVTDGETCTLLIAEKYVSSDDYQMCNEWGNMDSMFNGFCSDNCRSTYFPPQQDQPGLLVTGSGSSPTVASGPTASAILSKPPYPGPSSLPANQLLPFGSVHNAVFNAVFCDGAVHPLSYNINQQIFWQFGNRCDGTIHDLSPF